MNVCMGVYIETILLSTNSLYLVRMAFHIILLLKLQKNELASLFMNTNMISLPIWNLSLKMFPTSEIHLQKLSVMLKN